MFCFQCQEAAQNVACKISGVCGKTPSLANTMDIYKEALKGLALVNTQAKSAGITCKEADDLIINGLFKLITNANFNELVFAVHINKAIKLREELKTKLDNVEANITDEWVNMTVSEITSAKYQVGTETEEDLDIRSMKEFVITGLMGMSAYVSHANHLGFGNQEITDFISQALSTLLDSEKDLNDYIALVDEVGKYSLLAMQLLDEANTSTYGSPEITNVNISTFDKPGILVTGHDLKDLEMLLEQSKDAGIDIYTHGEMLPAHFYPKLKEYPHLKANYGNAWYLQTKEFNTFNGPILFTTNCLVPPKSDAQYADKVYTTSNVGYEGFTHISANANGEKDFTEIIEHAKRCDKPVEIETGTIVGGFAHGQVAALAGTIVEQIIAGNIRKFVVMAGCDGRQKGRNYYTEFAKALPNDTVILTAGCAKFKYNKLDLGDINGIPRVLDAGQCNDSYSLIKTAVLLQEAFKLDSVNDLPLEFNIAWYEQKAVTVLLALLHLNIQNIKLGPTLPAFVSENVANFLIDTYKISTISDVKTDIKEMGLGL